MQAHIMLRGISLESFRSVSHASYSINTPVTAIIGPNGSGKTTILEAISLLMPGKGLRASRLDDITQRLASFPSPRRSSWRCSLTLAERTTTTNDTDPASLGTAAPFNPSPMRLQCYLDPQLGRKEMVDDAGMRIHSRDLLRQLRVLWLSPELENIFQGATQERRNYIDRMTYSLYPDHADSFRRYNHYLKSRMRLLKQGTRDDGWYTSIEHHLAQAAIEVARNRLMAIAAINAQLAGFTDFFSTSHVSAIGEVEDILRAYFTEGEYNIAAEAKQDSTEVAATVAARFAKARPSDAASGRSLFGVHRTTYQILLARNDGELRPAEFCSTGEQKILLAAAFLANARAVAAQPDAPSLILLLDDICAHLDDHHQEVLAQILQPLGQQILITGCHPLPTGFSAILGDMGCIPLP